MKPEQKVLLNAIQDGRLVCPMPRHWHAFYNKFSRHVAFRKSTMKLPMPAILTSWGGTNDFEKNSIFLTQLHVLETVQLLKPALRDLIKLNDDDWLTSEEPLEPEEKSYFDIVSEDYRISEKLVSLFSESGITEIPEGSVGFDTPKLRRTFLEWCELHKAKT